MGNLIDEVMKEVADIDGKREFWVTASELESVLLCNEDTEEGRKHLAVVLRVNREVAQGLRWGLSPEFTD